MKKLILEKGKENSLKRFHPWVFSGAISKNSDKVKEGEAVEIFSASGEYLATGYTSLGSIAVRIISFKKTEIDAEFWKEKISQAIASRKLTGILGNDKTNVFRLFNAEGDGLPGLIIDFYNGTAVIQAHSHFIHNNQGNIINALKNELGELLLSIYDKSAAVLNDDTIQDQYLFGNSGAVEVSENGNRFYVNWEEGQKTGFFIDQRENRKLLGAYSKGKKVLNTFCYSGGFSVYALNAGATHVTSIDASKKAMEWTDRNINLNGFSTKEHLSVTGDVMDYLKTCDDDLDIMVLDPPAFAKNIKARHRAVQGYRRLNEMALKKIKTGGLIFTFSCSQAVERQLFENTIRAAAIDAKRQIKILHHLSQPSDHPTNIFHPEGEYLKGLVLLVE